MKLFTRKDLAALARNATLPEADRKPVVKLFNPGGTGTWLISEKRGDTLFGLCDLGFPELGNVSLSELEAFTGRFGLRIERDKYFEPEMTLDHYAKEAQIKGSITA